MQRLDTFISGVRCRDRVAPALLVMGSTLHTDKRTPAEGLGSFRNRNNLSQSLHLVDRPSREVSEGGTTFPGQTNAHRYRSPGLGGLSFQARVDEGDARHWEEHDLPLRGEAQGTLLCSRCLEGVVVVAGR